MQCKLHSWSYIHNLLVNVAPHGPGLEQCKIFTHKYDDLCRWQGLHSQGLCENAYQRMFNGSRRFLLITGLESHGSGCTAGGIASLVELLRSEKLLFQRLAAAVVCHVSERPQVCEVLVRYGAVSALINLLSYPQAELHSRCAVILADLAGHSDQYKALIAQLVSPTQMSCADISRLRYDDVCGQAQEWS